MIKNNCFCTDKWLTLAHNNLHHHLPSTIYTALPISPSTLPLSFLSLNFFLSLSFYPHVLFSFLSRVYLCLHMNPLSFSGNEISSFFGQKGILSFISQIQGLITQGLLGDRVSTASPKTMLLRIVMCEKSLSLKCLFFSSVSIQNPEIDMEQRGA